MNHYKRHCWSRVSVTSFDFWSLGCARLRRYVNNNSDIVLRSADRSQYLIQCWRRRMRVRANHINSTTVSASLALLCDASLLFTDVHNTLSHRPAVDRLPSLHVLNPTSLDKPPALQQLVRLNCLWQWHCCRYGNLLLKPTHRPSSRAPRLHRLPPGSTQATRRRYGKWRSMLKLIWMPNLAT